MANVTITQLPQAGPILGTESVPIVQNGQTVQTTTAAIAASPSQVYQYLTTIQTPNLPNSRYLAAGAGLLLTDGGAQSTYTISLDSTLSSFNSALAGVMVKTDSSTVTNRFMSASGAGITVTNGDGVAGNPTYSLTGNVASLANTTGNGMLTFINGFGVQPVTITGTASEVDVTNGTGVSGNPTIGIADNPILPGVQYAKLPVGGSSDRPMTGSFGMIRANTDSQEYEVFYNGVWTDLATAAGFVDVYNNGNLVGTQDGINFIPGTGFTYTITNNSTLNRVDVTQGLANTAVSAGSYGSASQVGTFTVDAQGRLTAASSTSIAIAASQITSGEVSVGRGGTGTNTFTANGVLYGNGASALQATAVGATNEVLVGNTASAPTWAALSGLTIGTATNLAGGAAGSLPYQTGAGATSFLSLGTSTYILTAGASAPQYSDPSGITVGTATNVAGGTANQIVYNTAAGATSFIVAPTVANTYLEWSGSAFQWSANPLGTVTSVDVSGGTTGLTTSGGPITTSGTITLAGTLAVANGGTGQTSYTDGQLLIGNSTGNTLTKATLTAGTGITVTNGSGSISIAAINNGTVTSVDASGGTTGLSFSGGPITTSGTLTLAGTLITSNGGTGLTTYTAGDLVYYASGTALSKLGIGSSTYILTSTGTAPQWSDPAGVTVGTATNVATTATSTNATYYPTFVDATSGNNAIEVDTDLTYNPSTNTLTVPNLVATSGISGGTF